MKAVLQRVSSASVAVDGKVCGSCENGFLILLGVKQGDTEQQADLLAEKVANLRVFSDENGKMNLSLLTINGGALVISNFTLYADCHHGRRPNFLNAEKPDNANRLYEYFCSRLTSLGVSGVEKGEFGADMQVSLVNDGPVTIVLDTDTEFR
ncbi:MAG: D-tyrosyl-tRNA(Tyr) deacylase [Ruminococcus sp.]|nr:D-tyrosyl-tRNA(Tyr) deacylase [Ruminococcus sp.]